MKTATPNNETNTDIQINVLFKKMQKDDKKEVLMFHILSDETKHAADLLRLTGKMTILTISDDEGPYEPIQAEFVNLQRDNKKTVLKFNVATEDVDRVNAIYPAAGTNISLLIQPQQMSIDDLEDEHEGISYEVGSDGTVEVNSSQDQEE
ncbi:hypothetical protein U1P98_22935 [Lysinibacillus irui]|uniref:General stress protein 17M-like domain-containing protein n=2 Tax=Lysinibacillus irui TaxID=2998077 RepID=A0ABU5NSU9_9BACI|nr:hypothetical protein [Lysinibacillus irui]MEA0979138.1 hypothetical protein [Lysinibacillus irui]MEA1045292.1 hypothetical protein [Lysinibacillus irui]